MGKKKKEKKRKKTFDLYPYYIQKLIKMDHEPKCRK